MALPLPGHVQRLRGVGAELLERFDDVGFGSLVGGEREMEAAGHPLEVAGGQGGEELGHQGESLGHGGLVRHREARVQLSLGMQPGWLERVHQLARSVGTSVASSGLATAPSELVRGDAGLDKCLDARHSELC
jgi:UDP:flavonoid glycosyltransferase YjiC (YdhE family)